MANDRTEPTLDAGPLRRSLGRNRAAPMPDPPPDDDGVIPDDVVADMRAEGAGPRPKGIDLDALLVDVFEQTGVKVTADDPVVAAALIQSSVMRRAGRQASADVEQAVVKAVAALAEAVKQERETAAHVDRSVTSAVAQISEAAKAASAAELGAMKASFARSAAHALDQVSRQASLNRVGVAWRMVACLAVGLATGLIATPLLVKSSGLSEEQMRLIHNGLILDRAWPKLPASARSLMEVPKAAPAVGEQGKKAAP